MWTKTTLEWYIDGVLVREASHNISEEMFLTFSLAVGGWAGDPDATTDFSDGLSVDYVRVYQSEKDRKANPEVDLDGSTPQDKLGATRGADTLYGTHWGDVMDGAKGDDTLYGRAGDDHLFGGDGADTIYGSDGRDHLSGGNGGDQLVGGSGGDVLNGGSGNDDMWGGSFGADGAADIFVLERRSGSDTIHDFELEWDVIQLANHRGDWINLTGGLIDEGWATKITLSSVGGARGDTLYLAGVSVYDLTAEHFVFGDLALV